MTIKAVLFDLDDTLLRTSWSGHRRVRMAFEALRPHHPDLSWREFRAAVTTIDAEHGFWRGIAPGLNELGLRESPAAERAIGFWTFASCPEFLRPSPFVARTLRKLRTSYGFGVVTNGSASVQRHKFDGLRLEEDFPVFLTSEEAGFAKPEPEIFHAALVALSLRPHEAVFVGDSLSMDIAGASKAGLRAIWYNPSSRWYRPSSLEAGSQVAPEATIRRFDELPAILRQIDVDRPGEP